MALMECDPEAGTKEVEEPLSKLPPVTSKAGKKKFVLFGVCLAALTALAIGLGVGLSSRNSGTQNPQSTGGGSNSDTGSAVDKTGNNVNVEESVVDETGSSGTGKDNDKEPVQPQDPIYPILETAVVNEPEDTPTVAKALAFNVNVQPFSTDVLTGYSDCDDLETDIEMALKFGANKIIAEQSERECKDYWYRPIPYAEMEDAAIAAPTTMSLSSPGKGSKETSYGTNNQVEGVEEADAIQSDGTHIFMAYGSEIVVIDLDGIVVTKEKIPSPTEDLNNDSKVMDSDIIDAQPKSMLPIENDEISISSLLLNGNRVVALAHKYDYKARKNVSGGTTMAFIYQFDILSKTPLTLVHQEEIAGRYKTARAIGKHAHVVTSAYINTWGFNSALYRCSNKMYKNMTNDEYFAAATAQASESAPVYASGVMVDLLGEEDGTVSSCQHIVQINSMMSGSVSGMESAMTSRKAFFSRHNQILNSFHQVTSFDFTSDANSLKATRNKAGAFMNQGSVETYASESNLVLAGRGWNYNEDSSYDEYTMLLGFTLNGVEAKPSAVGEVTGYLLNSYSLDWWNGHLRVATTNSQKGSMVPKEGDATSMEWVVTSPSTSQVTILEYSGKEMVITGQINDLGVGERIYSARFLEDKAFVVTFRQVDPLYALDLADPKNPVKKGEVKITGFSNYMKLVQSNYLLTVGQEADETGRTTGLKITLFDVGSLDEPKEHDKYVEESRSYSSAQYDFHAFRYLEKSKRLIIPVSTYVNWQDPEAVNFDGFKVYNVDATNKIEPSASVTHANDDNWDWCYSQARLPSRSMVFDGKLVTFKGHSVRMSDDLETPEMVWDRNLDEGREKRKSYCWRWW
eukprot:CAMPEP_0195510954 /NCGR_PEP_ID=MMETSP0794_2-20130614/3440_1 /TAXON_ID=515487 /ORGANISM="Stephanopyxis turris, Strain CCMP 815" /LENGTH=854 /DNA_ID=CAMNT_0040638477 /DNA_START=91 /DNA_END=2655 /DNA_ORIENTATION=-